MTIRALTITPITWGGNGYITADISRQAVSSAEYAMCIDEGVACARNAESERGNRQAHGSPVSPIQIENTTV